MRLIGISTIVTILLNIGMLTGAQAQSSPTTFDFGALKCSGESFDAYDYTYTYAYSEVTCVTDAEPRKPTYQLARRDLRHNRSELIDLAATDQEFFILGTDRKENLYWVADHHHSYNPPLTELSVNRTNLAMRTTDAVIIKFDRPAIRVYNSGYYNGGYLVQAVDQAGKRLLYGLGPDGDVQLVYDETNSPCAYTCHYVVPNTFYSPLVIYTVDGNPGEDYQLKSVEVINGHTRSVCLTEAQLAPFEIITDYGLEISASPTCDRFIIGNFSGLGRADFEKRSELARKNFEDTSLDSVIVYDAKRAGSPFFTVRQPYYGKVGLSPDGQLFYRWLAYSTEVRSIETGTKIYSASSLTSDIKFLDNQTLLLNHSSHSDIIKLPQ